MRAKHVSLAAASGVFSAELVDHMAEARAAGQCPRDFGLSEHTHLMDQISGACSNLHGFSRSFRRRLGNLPPCKRGVSFTRAESMVALCSLFGWDFIYQDRAAGVDAETCPVSRRGDASGPVMPIHVVSAGQSPDRWAESRSAAFRVC